jgi:hypothetical protein
LRLIIFLTLTCLAACSSFGTGRWFGPRKPAVPGPTELIVTGAPPGSTLFVDGVQAAEGPVSGAGPQVVRVTPGPHIVEVRLGDPVVYREQTEPAPGERRVITVLSGSGR